MRRRECTAGSTRRPGFHGQEGRERVLRSDGDRRRRGGSVREGEEEGRWSGKDRDTDPGQLEGPVRRLIRLCGDDRTGQEGSTCRLATQTAVALTATAVVVLGPGVFKPVGGIAGGIVGIAGVLVRLTAVLMRVVGITGVLVSLPGVLMGVLHDARVVMTAVFDGGVMRTMTSLAAEAAGVNEPRKHEDLQEQGQAQGTEATNRRAHYPQT